MYKNSFIGILFLFILVSCDVEDEIPADMSPGSFNVSVVEVTDRSANLNWTPSIDPEGQSVTYTILLEGEVMDASPFATSYTFSGLTAETSYRGKVIASSNSGDTEVAFSFTTGEFQIKVFEGDVRLTTQQQVDDFGDHAYNRITGSVGIEPEFGPTTDIEDLSPLKDLMEVENTIHIWETSLESLEGLGNLRKIGGDLSITYNRKLKSLRGLESLDIVDGKLSLFFNPLIENTEPLNYLSSIGEIYISKCENLKRISLLYDALSVDHLYIYDNKSLEKIEGFENIREIKYDLEFSSNPLLNTIPSFNDLTTINGGLYLLKNHIEELGFLNLESVTYSLEIIDNTPLLSFEGFHKLEAVGREFFIWNNPLLSNFCNFSTLVNEGEVGSMFVISGNAYNPSFEDIQEGNCQL